MELGEEIGEQPPNFGKSPSVPDIMLWSLKMRWWASRVAGPKDNPAPDVKFLCDITHPMIILFSKTRLACKKA